MLSATGCEPPSVAASEYKRELHFPWNDGDTFRGFQQSRGIPLSGVFIISRKTSAAL